MFILRKLTAFLVVVVFAAAYLFYPAAAAVSHDLTDKVIILDAGHGAENPNAYEDYEEQATMLDLSYKLKPLLEAVGAKVLLVRPGEEDLPLPVRAATINKWALEAVRDARLEDGGAASEINEINRLIGVMQSVIDDPETNAPIYFNIPFDYTYTREIHPDLRRIFELEDDPVIKDRFLVISLHSNATGKPIKTEQNGVEVYYISNDLEKNATYYSQYSNVERSFYFANLLIDNISEVGLEKRYVKDYYYFMTREHNLPCVLAENGYHTNEHDRELLMNSAFRSRLAQVYVETIQQYFDEIEYWLQPEAGVFG